MQFYMGMLLWLAVLAVIVALVQLLWNTTLPKIGPFGKVTYFQALRLVLMLWLLAGAARVTLSWSL
jgi:hypothetical protein